MGVSRGIIPALCHSAHELATAAARNLLEGPHRACGHAILDRWSISTLRSDPLTNSKEFEPKERADARPYSQAGGNDRPRSRYHDYRRFHTRRQDPHWDRGPQGHLD